MTLKTTIDKRAGVALRTHLSLEGGVVPGAPGDGQHRGLNAVSGIEPERAVCREGANVFENVREEAFGNETFGGHGLDAVTLRQTCPRRFNRRKQNDVVNK